MRSCAAVMALTVLACTSTTTSSPGECPSAGQAESGFDRKAMLRDFADVVIIPSLEATVTSSTALHTSVTTLCSAPDAASLDAAQETWRSARHDWKRTSAFLFGPAEELFTAKRVDAWPTSPVFIDSAITNGSTIDEAYVASRTDTERGFPAIEYLLFGRDRDDVQVLAALSADAKRCSYLVAAAADVRTNLAALVEHWKSQYRTEFVCAGRGSATYPTVKAGVDQVVNALIAVSESVANYRLRVPLGLDEGVPDPSAVESPYSDNSIADMLDIVESIESLHRAKRGGTDAQGLDDYLMATNPDVNPAVMTEINELRAALQAIPPPLRTAVTDNTALVEAAWNHARDVKRVYGTSVVAALGVTLVFNDMDSD